MTHEMIHTKGPGSLRDVLAGFLSVSSGFVEQPQVEMGVAQLVPPGFKPSFHGSCQHGGRFAPSGVEVQDLLHRYPDVFAHWK